MLHIKSLDEGLEIFKTLGSDVRIEIIKILLDNNSMSMNELASRLKITNGALTSHIKKLEGCGLITVSNETVEHGNQKKCSTFLDKILIEVNPREEGANIYQTDLKIGHYTDYKVYPTCGLASATAIVGEVDDARYFSHPDRYNADILWFTKGYVEYVIPNFIPFGQKIDQITISLEIGSEAPGSNDVWPSDIAFSLNNTKIVTWTSPGDFGSVRGIFTPDWWHPNWNQFGLYKIIVIDRNGSFVDGLKLSNVTINDFGFDYRSEIRLKMEVGEDAEHMGGLTIYGKTFGNYNQDISVHIKYSPVVGDRGTASQARLGI